MREQANDMEEILFECAGFPIVTRYVREQTGLPVYDVVANAKILMSGYNLAIEQQSKHGTC